jgi:nucleotide-binding universal stress UspA family protein
VRLRERSAPTPPGDVTVAGSDPRPVVLATLAVPFEPEAFRIALQAAMESSVTLIVVDAIELPFWPQSIATRHAETELESDRARIKELVTQAAGLGVEVEHLRVRSPRPAEAVIQIAAERRAGLLVFGPDPSRFRPRFFSRVVRRIRKRASCLLWIAGEGP